MARPAPDTAVDLPQIDPRPTRTTGAPRSDLRGPTIYAPSRDRAVSGWGWLAWAARPVDLHQPDADHGIRNAWVAAGVAAQGGVQAWYFYGRQSQLVSYVVVRALVALVLTP
jgi:hypothetical protein